MSMFDTAVSRRAFLSRCAAYSAAFGGLHLVARSGLAAAVRAAPGGEPGYGPLVPDPAKVLDLPAGFTYTVISRVGEKMADGLRVPGLPDGMAAFPGPDGLVILVRNHEIARGWAKVGAFGPSFSLLSKVNRDMLFDGGRNGQPSLGGTTTLVYDPKSRSVVRQALSLGGTDRNCAGGPTPWGTWLTCEEPEMDHLDPDELQQHGWVFEVPAAANPALVKAEPIRPMGRFRHEAVAVDATSGVIYLTEDVADGLLYRYVPKERQRLLAGGKLQALVLRDHGDKGGCDTGNRGKGPEITKGVPLATRWMDLDEVESPKNDLRHRGAASGAAIFNRNEGAWAGMGAAYFASTCGGKALKGQLWKYTPSAHEGTPDEEREPGTLELFVEPNDFHLMENPDNITAAPWGDLIGCEDGIDPLGKPRNRLLGITPGGTVYTLAQNPATNSEFAGATFSPDGSTLFVNIQGDGLTLAITGPWRTKTG